MGFFLRYALFYEVTSEGVYAAYARFYAERNQPLQAVGDDFYQLTIHEADNRWVVLALDRGWEREVRQKAYLFTSQLLSCSGFFIYVYDGLHWGYECFDKGVVLDQYVSVVEPDGVAYCDESDTCSGNADLIATYFPPLNAKDVAPYLMKKPSLIPDENLSAYSERKAGLDIPPRPGDEYPRFHPSAVLNFLRMLGVRVEVRDGYVTPLSPKYQSFWVKYRQYHHEVKS